MKTHSRFEATCEFLLHFSFWHLIWDPFWQRGKRRHEFRM